MKRIKSVIIDLLVVLFGTVIAVVFFTLRLHGSIEEITLNSFIGFFTLFFGLVKISEVIFAKHQTLGELFIGLKHVDKNNQYSLKRRIWRDFIILFFLMGSFLIETYAGYLIAAILLLPAGKNERGQFALMIDYLVGLNCIDVRESYPTDTNLDNAEFQQDEK